MNPSECWHVHVINEVHASLSRYSYLARVNYGTELALSLAGIILSQSNSPIEPSS
ncbi:hypothetical protein CY34DRAFT_809945 [Suillus luteus UH-Slu-Lm8-n1]|uniref:Uncharacterized protein n=1 Tax=Suillus luteus UH-Slu-Lm8-n1 TaxID=930992 RepID=A0A0C9ZK68_9AGAM|nr:hypothetical protein CY34DRAFT_809945 [Suillus luteus UH-Slu-Lm8-n1]